MPTKGPAVRSFRSLLALVSLTTTLAVSAQPLSDRLPASTWVYTGWSPNAALQDTKAARMLADERLIQPWRILMQRWLFSMPDELGAGEPRLSEHLPHLLADAAQCEGCFALLDLKPDHGEVIPQAVLILNLGARRAHFEEHFKPIHAKLKERLGERLHMMKLENSWLWMKTTRDKPDYTWGFIGDSFVFYFGDGADKFLPTLSAKPELNLKNSPGFIDCLGKIPGESLLTTYVDLKKSMSLVQLLIKAGNDDGLRMLSQNWMKVAVELGIDNLQSLGEKTTVQDSQFVTRSLIRTAGAPHGLVSLFGGAAVDDAMLKAIPADAALAVAFRLDLLKVYTQFKASAIAIAGEDGEKTFGLIEDTAAGFGVPVKNLLAPLGDQWVIYEASSTGGILFTGLTLIVDVKDVDTLNRTLTLVKQLLLAQFNGDARVTIGAYEVDGVTIQYVDPGRGFNFFNPAWAVADKKLIVALYPQVVEDAIRQMKSSKSLLDHPQFIETRRQIGDGGPMVYLSAPEFVRSVYPLLLPFISAMRDSFIGDNSGNNPHVYTATLLPSLQRALAYVGTDAFTIKITPDGILRTKSVANPLLSPMTLTDSIALWVAVALPTLGTAKATADRVHGGNNLREIGQGMILYANDHQGKMPPDLATLIKAQNLKKEIFQSPFGDGKPEGDYKYLYVEGMTNAMPADIITVYDAAEFEKGDGAGVLYGDGHSEWIEKDGVTLALEKSAKWREEQKAKGK